MVSKVADRTVLLWAYPHRTVNQLSFHLFKRVDVSKEINQLLLLIKSAFSSNQFSLVVAYSLISCSRFGYGQPDCLAFVFCTSCAVLILYLNESYAYFCVF